LSAAEGRAGKEFRKGTARSAIRREGAPGASKRKQPSADRAQPRRPTARPRHKAMQSGGTVSNTATTGGRRRVSVQSTRSAAVTTSASSVWEARMKMDEVKGGVKVFSAGAADEPADEEGMRVYRRLRRNQSEGNGTGAAGAASAAAAKKRRSWKASEPVTAIGDLRTTRSDAAAAVTTATTTTAVVARRAVAPVSKPEKKVAPAAAAGEVKEVVVVEVHKAAAADAKNVVQQPDEELDDDDAEDELLDEELDQTEEEEKEMLDQDHMAIDNEQTALDQGKNP